VPGEGPSGDQIDAVMRASRALVGIAAAAVAEWTTPALASTVPDY